MNETPTPRTDEQVNGKPCTRFEVLGGDPLRDAYVPSQFARTLERDLTAVTKQRDRLAEALQKLADCDWFITVPNRMDAVRVIANKALQSITPNKL